MKNIVIAKLWNNPFCVDTNKSESDVVAAKQAEARSTANSIIGIYRTVIL